MCLETKFDKADDLCFTFYTKLNMINWKHVFKSCPLQLQLPIQYPRMQSKSAQFHVSPL